MSEESCAQLSQAYLARFGGVARLYGQAALSTLAKAHVVVVGLGGVGSWAAEALARSGVGTLTLIELDDVCITNTNRQLHATQTSVGQSKLHVLASRLKDINPELTVHTHLDFLSTKNMNSLIKPSHQVVIDAMDASSVKAGLVAYCSAIKVRVVMCGSSGGKQDPSRIQVGDLGSTTNDAMLAKVRTQLYRHYNFARDRGRKFRVDAVYSTEQMVYPKPDGSVCMTKQVLQSGVKLDCTGGFGSSVMVTGSFGFLAAERAVSRLLKQ